MAAAGPTHLQWRNEVVYAFGASAMASAAERLQGELDQARALAAGERHPHLTLGFDAEWKPQFRAGEKENKVALLQLCTRHTAYLFHIIYGGVPRGLRAILADPTVSKVGVGAGDDAARLRRHYPGVEINAVADLEAAAAKCLPADVARTKRRWGLSELCQRLVGLPVAKGRVRTSNWQKRPLTDAQQAYAATDAYAGLLLAGAIRQRGQSGRRHNDLLPIEGERCPKCDFCAVTKQRLIEHQQRAGHMFKCPRCTRTCATLTAMHTHQKQSAGHMFECSGCANKFYESVDIDAHVRHSFHPFVCSSPGCNKVTHSVAEHEAHAATCFRCPFCPANRRPFKSLNGLHDHQRATNHVYFCHRNDCDDWWYVQSGVVHEHADHRHYECAAPACTFSAHTYDEVQDHAEYHGHVMKFNACGILFHTREEGDTHHRYCHECV